VTSFAPILLAAGNPGPMTGPGTNTYLIVGADRSAVLIDAGVGQAEHLAALDGALAENTAWLQSVLVTHGHVDHASGAPAIAAAHGQAVFAKYPWGEEDGRYAVEWRPLRDGDRLAVGEHTLTVMHTPGHSPDHVVFWHEASGSVFTGDLVTPGGSVMIPASCGGSLAAYLASLDKVLALGPRQLFPGHGPRVDDARALLVGHLEHRRLREQQVIAALDSGRRTVEAIADCIYDGLQPALMPAARENVRAHLAKLEAEGAASDHNGEWERSRHG
jgi:glyoxylase-like metal-dependent hydrolase (beta-lactamase superfamily II)